MIKKGLNEQTFSTGAVRSACDENGNRKGRMDLLPWEAIRLLSIHCENGVVEAGHAEHNVDLGIPQHSLIDSATRHIAKYLSGWKDEDHLVSAAWNIMFALQQTVTHPELIDVPWAADKKE